MLKALHPNCLHILGGCSSFVYAFGSGGVYFGGSGNLQPHFLHSLIGWSSLVLGLSKWLYILVIDHSPCLFFCNNYIFMFNLIFRFTYITRLQNQHFQTCYCCRGQSITSQLLTDRLRASQLNKIIAAGENRRLTI